MNNIASHEFNVSMKDLAIAEVHLDFLSREARNSVDNAVEAMSKMRIEIDSIKQPNLQTMAKVNEFTEVMDVEFKRIKDGIEAKKAEILKTEQDYSAYDAAIAEAKNMVEQDLKAATAQYKKSNPMA